MLGIWQFSLLILALYGGIVALMHNRQESLLFFPPAATHNQTLPEKTEFFELQQPGAFLRGWLVNRQWARERLLIYYGGNAEDVYYSLDDYTDLQLCSAFVAYRGYSPSSGSPGEREFYSDALAIFDQLVASYQPSQVFLVGRSLGSGVATYVASKRAVAGTVLVTPYDSIEAVARSAYPWLPVRLLLRHRFPSVKYAAELQAPVLVVYGGADSVIPPRHTRELLQHLPAELTRELYLPTADHNNIHLFPKYWQTLLEFFDQVSTEREQGG